MFRQILPSFDIFLALVALVSTAQLMLALQVESDVVLVSCDESTKVTRILSTLQFCSVRINNI